MNEIQKGRNFISTDKKVAINSYGECFVVGEMVAHQDSDVGQAIITSFEVNEIMNEVKVNTDKGYAHIDFLIKLENNEN